MEKNERWFELKALPTCSCGRSLCKKGMLRELQSNKLHRPGPSAGMIRSSVVTIRLDCFGCGRSWDARFLCVDRFERGTARAVPTDCWPIRWNESPEDALDHIIENRRREQAGEAPVQKAQSYVPVMSQEDAERARRHIAEARARFGWPS
jgi:hypothetical protein